MSDVGWLKGAIVVLLIVLCAIGRALVQQKREHESWRGLERRKEERRRR